MSVYQEWINMPVYDPYYDTDFGLYGTCFFSLALFPQLWGFIAIVSSFVLCCCCGNKEGVNREKWHGTDTFARY